MARSTQLRLDAVTGSVAALKPAGLTKGAEAASFAAADLQDILKGYAQAIANIHGSAEFTAQEPGLHTQMTRIKGGDLKVQEAGGADKFVVNNAFGHVSGSGDYVFKGAYLHSIIGEEGEVGVESKTGKVKVISAGDQPVALFAAGAGKVEMWAGGAKKMHVSSSEVRVTPAFFADASLNVAGDSFLNGNVNLGNASGDDIHFQGRAWTELTPRNDLTVSLGDSTHRWATAFVGTGSFDVAKVSGLTATRVVFAGPNGQLVDDAGMTYDAAQDKLTIAGDLAARDVAARSGSFTGDLSVSGDLKVLGAMTYLDTQNLLVKDAKIVISSGSLVDGAGIYLGDEAAGENIRWDVAGDKWIASDKFAADTMQALDLSSAIVWADASGNLVEISNADLGGAINGRLAEGTGVDFALDAGTGVTTISIGQEVYTTSSVTFAAVTGSNLTASRLMASNGSKAMVSADLSAWVAGTANRVSVADDGDGSITLSAPQDIHSGASPEFAALNIGTAHDIMADGANLKLATTGYLKFADAEGTYELAKSGEYSLFDAKFTATSIVGALVELANGGGGGKGKEVVAIASDVTAAGGKYPVVLASLDLAPLADAATAEKRLDVYLNGQLMVQGSDYSVIIADDKLNFEFALKADDVVVAIVR